MIRRHTFNGLFNIVGIQNDQIIHDDFSVTMGIELLGKSHVGLANHEFNQDHSILQQLFAKLPEGANIHYIFQNTQDNTDIIDKFINQPIHDTDIMPLFQDEINQLVNYNKNKTLNNYKIYFLYTYTDNRVKSKTKAKTGNKTKHFMEILKQDYESLQKKAKSNFNDILATMATIQDLKYKKLTSENLFDLTYNHINQTNEKKKMSMYNPLDFSNINYKLDSSNIAIYKKYLKINDEKYITYISATSIPRFFTPGMLVNFFTTWVQYDNEITEYIPFDIHIKFNVPNQAQRILQYEEKRKTIRLFNPSGTNEKSNMILQEMNQIIADLGQEKDKVIDFTMTIKVEADDPSILEQRAKKIRDMFRSYLQADAVIEDITNFEMHKLHKPGSTGLKKGRVKPVFTQNVADLVGIYKTWEGHISSPIIPFLTTPYRTPFFFDMMNKELPAFNQVISGQTGRGKSFLMARNIVSTYKEDVKYIIIDVGEGYKKLTKYFDGTFIQVDLYGSIKLNPWEFSTKIALSTDRNKILGTVNGDMVKTLGNNLLPEIKITDDKLILSGDTPIGTEIPLPKHIFNLLLNINDFEMEGYANGEYIYAPSDTILENPIGEVFRFPDNIQFKNVVKIKNLFQYFEKDKILYDAVGEIVGKVEKTQNSTSLYIKEENSEEYRKLTTPFYIEKLSVSVYGIALDKEQRPLGWASTIPVDPSSMKFLLTVTELMVKEKNEEGLDKITLNLLEENMAKTYEKVFPQNRFPIFSDFKEVIENSIELNEYPPNETDILNKIARILQMWTDGPYGNIFNNQSNVDFSDKIIAFNLQGLHGHEDIQEIFVYTISELIKNYVTRNTGKTKTIVVYDECWKFLAQGKLADLMEENARTMRKNRAAAIFIIQEIAGIANSTKGLGLIINTPIKWFLPQGAPAITIKQIMKQFNENDLLEIDSLESQKGKYSDVYLSFAGNSQKLNNYRLRLEVTPIMYWLGTSEKPDLQMLKEFMDENPSYSFNEAINQIAEIHPHGAFHNILEEVS